MTSAGPQPTSPETLNDGLIAAVAALVPGYTANLPGSLIEDISSTDTAALYQIDQARIDLINSITPYGANLFILNQMAACAGVPTQGAATTTTVYCVFTGSPGYIVPSGLVVGDGTYLYTVQDGGVIGTGGASLPLYCVANIAGSWAVNANTVNQISTSLPSGVGMTVNNPTAGTPGGVTESEQAFRARSLQAYVCGGTGMISFLKTLLSSIPNVQPRLISVLQNGSNYEIICGGGDPYQIAFAIYTAIFYLPGIVGSSTTARNITVSIYDYPDTYPITFVNPPLQTVGIVATWNTTATNMISAAAVAQLASQAIMNYINSISVGKPINEFELGYAFQQAISSIIPVELLTRLIFTVSINGVGASPVAGTGIILSDPESYFYTTSTAIAVNQG